MEKKTLLPKKRLQKILEEHEHWLSGDRAYPFLNLKHKIIGPPKPYESLNSLYAYKYINHFLDSEPYLVFGAYNVIGGRITDSVIRNSYIKTHNLYPDSVKNQRNVKKLYINNTSFPFTVLHTAAFEDIDFYECDFKNSYLYDSTINLDTTNFKHCSNILMMSQYHAWPLVLIRHDNHTAIYCGCRVWGGPTSLADATTHWEHHEDNQRREVVLPLLEGLAHTAKRLGWVI